MGDNVGLVAALIAVAGVGVIVGTRLEPAPLHCGVAGATAQARGLRPRTRANAEPRGQACSRPIKLAIAARIEPLGMLHDVHAAGWVQAHPDAARDLVARECGIAGDEIET